MLVVEPQLEAQRAIRDACAEDDTLRFVGFVQRPMAAVTITRVAAPAEALVALRALRETAGGAPVVLFGSPVNEAVAACAQSAVPRHRADLIATMAVALAGDPAGASERS